MNAAVDVVAGIAVAEVVVDANVVDAADVVNAVEIEVDVDVVVVDGTQLLVRVFVIVTVVVGGSEVVPPSTVRVVVSDDPCIIVTVAMFTFTTASAWTALFASAPVESAARTAAKAAPVRALLPSKVTRAFWDEQLRFPALSLDRIFDSERVIEKLVDACVSRRGRASPSVTLLILVSPAIVVVTHPTVSDVEQSNPVKPLVQMQEQMPFVTTLDPPFLQVSWF